METKMKNKKIAIMTWHHVNNYGTALQAFALKNIIELCGYKVDIVNYYRKDSSHLVKRSLIKYILDFLLNKYKMLFNVREYIFSEECFKNFYDTYFTYTSLCVSKQDFYELNSKYDGFICGSDQIWSPRWFDSHFFLDFVINDNQKIAYAPSFGVINLNSFDMSDEITNLTNRFSSLSVREKTGTDELKSLTKRNDIKNVLDPVFLLSRSQWENLLQLPENTNEPYMFIFFLKNNNKYFKIAIAEAKKRGLKTIIMHSTQSEDNRFYNIEAPSPEKMLGLIKNATYVCTDSFHIMVFSIIFNKQFEVFKKTRGALESQNNRLTELLDRLNIGNRIYNGRFGEEINYENVNELLFDLKNESMNYLIEALEKLPDERINKCIEKKICYSQQCEGEQIKEYEEYLNDLSIFKRKFATKHMTPWNFCLEKKCFECRYLKNNSRNQNNSMPFFYKELRNDLLKKRKFWYIYFKYYRGYEVPMLIKKVIRKRGY